MQAKNDSFLFRNLFNQYKNIICFSVGFFLLFIPQSFFTIAISDYLQKIGIFTSGIITIVYGVFNIFGIFVVKYLGYRVSLIIGGILLLPFFVAATICKVIVGAKIIPDGNNLLIRKLMYSTGVFNGIGQSIIWIAQGCYISGISNDQTVSRSYSIFNFLFNLTFPIGNAIMWLFGNSNNYAGLLHRKDTITLIIMDCLSLAGIALFLVIKPLKVDVKEKLCISSNLLIILRAFRDIVPLMPAMSFMGVFITFVGVGMNISYANGTESHRYFATMTNGIFTVCASLLCIGFLTQKRLIYFIAAACVFHLIAFVMFAADVSYMPVTMFKHVFVNIFCAFLGFANSIFITCIYDLISVRYEYCVSIAMWIFMVLNGIIGGLMCLPFNSKEWAMILALFAIPAYIGMFGESFAVQLKSKRETWSKKKSESTESSGELI